MCEENISPNDLHGMQVVGDLFSTQSRAIRLCLDNALPSQALILIYVTIDQLAYLNMSKDKTDVTGNDFKEWCDKYMLFNNKGRVDCESADLWGARCGLLHTYTPESRASRNGKARQVFYAWGRSDNIEAQLLLKESGLPSVIVHVDKLFEVFLDGAVAFFSTLDVDEQKRTVALERAHKMFANQRQFLPHGVAKLRGIDA